MAIIHVDNQPYPADPERNLLDVCLSLGFDLPYFCWHPAMGSVGACRQCAVKQYRDENDDQGRIVMACMTPAAEGTRIGLDEPEARAFRARVIEWLMLNHPHDCPVCEEGGECHLQDMTVMTGHNYRRFRGRKRTFRNQYLGPFINHEMNRCIACYRCVRFYQDYAGGGDLRAFAAHHHVYFGRHQDGVLENEFSGNLAEVCPTGVFTDRTFGERYVRKWDLQSAPSVCAHCGLGCNTSPNERYGVLRRIVNRYNGEVNGYFLCDRGRFGYDFVNSPDRVRQPVAGGGRGEASAPLDRDEALRRVGAALKDPSRTLGIGSPRASLEANHALRVLVGADRFHLGISEEEDRLLATAVEIMTQGPSRTPSLRETEQADAVLVLGEDLTNTAPRLALALRQAVRHRHMEIADGLGVPRWQDAAVREAAQDERSPLFVVTPDATRLDDAAAATLRATPEDIARLGFAVAHALDADAPAVPHLPAAMQDFVHDIAGALRRARRPLVVSGTGARSEAVMQAAANVARALGGNDRPCAELVLTAPECNSLGLKLMGGGRLEGAFERVRAGEVDAVVVLENDLYRRADQATVDAFIENVQRLIVVDHLRHATARWADLTLPAATFAEGDGTLVSNEARAQRFFQVYVPDGDVQESWRWLRDAMQAAGREPPAWRSLDDVTADCARSFAVFEAIPAAAPGAGFRIAAERVSRAPHRYSGRTAMRAHLDVHEREPAQDPDAPFSFSMEGYYASRKLPAALIPYFWSPGWNSEQSVNKFQDEIGGRLHGGDPGVRLLEPSPGARADYYQAVPDAFEARTGAWRTVALHHIFGGEELSAQAPAIAERAPAPYVALNPRDAAELSLAEGEVARVDMNGAALDLPVRHRPQLPRGVAGLPAGLPELAGVWWSAWARIERKEGHP